jgi:hypothetical protein
MALTSPPADGQVHGAFANVFAIIVRSGIATHINSEAPGEFVLSGSNFEFAEGGPSSRCAHCGLQSRGPPARPRDSIKSRLADHFIHSAAEKAKTVWE